MALLMARIDDRLVHGQVVVGCCEALRARRILVCDDAVAGDSMQRSLFAAAAPPEIDVAFVDATQAVPRLRELGEAGDDASTILLTRDCATMRSLAEAGAGLERVTVGGLHHREGARELVRGFHLRNRDREDLRALLEAGVAVIFQSVPGASKTDGAAILGAEEDPR